MSKSIKFTNDVYLDTSSVVYGRQKLNTYLASVIESGSNDNGSWIKYSDGTLIQYKSLVTIEANQESVTITLPLEYLKPNFTILLTALNYSHSYITYSSNTVSKNTFKVIATDIKTGTIPTSKEGFNFLTIGRWK